MDIYEDDGTRAKRSLALGFLPHGTALTGDK
jgi:hypothetical protein